MGGLKKTVARAGWREYLKGSMIPDISLGIIYCFVFFGLGVVAFAYLSKGKN